jgi:hypothetical protein
VKWRVGMISLESNLGVTLLGDRLNLNIENCATAVHAPGGTPKRMKIFAIFHRRIWGAIRTGSLFGFSAFILAPGYYFRGRNRL